MLVVGLTGGVASGKSFVANYLKKIKIPIHESDEVVRFLYKNPTIMFLNYLNKHGFKHAVFKKKIDKKIIKNVIIFDVFEGKNLSDNKKSIAFKVTMQPQEKTFTDPEIENISNNIIDLISKSFDGELRQ